MADTVARSSGERKERIESISSAGRSASEPRDSDMANSLRRDLGIWGTNEDSMLAVARGRGIRE